MEKSNSINGIILVCAVFVLGSLLYIFATNDFTKDTKALPSELTYTQFVNKVSDNTIDKVVIMGDRLAAADKEGKKYNVVIQQNDQSLIDLMVDSGVVVLFQPSEEPNFIYQNWPTLLLIIVIVWIAIYQMRKQREMMNHMNDSKTKNYQSEIKTKFDDVAGVDEAKSELTEVVEFLKNPASFKRLGARVPNGALLVGPPGTGKTLLARACAGEAGVPFFYVPASAFIEKFVGVGASRIRDLFTQAKKAAPCIVFIDEIDSIGKSRDNGFSTHSEGEQTLNQLLTEMDGFDGADAEQVVVLAATNRPDTLDKALLRAGRFDRHIHVGLPDIKGRIKILEVHAKKIMVDPAFSFDRFARGCVGMSGADLENLVNEAALVATRETGSEFVTERHFELAKDRILMGAERTTFIMSDYEKKITAYHEAGHAIIGYLVPEHDPVYKVSIVPRGRALGVTMYLPDDDRVSYSKTRLISQIKSLMGGRAAEELIFGSENITTGASNDIERATMLASKMVKEWGLSDLGPINYHHNDRSFVDDRSQRVLDSINTEVRALVDNGYRSAIKLLEENMPKLHKIAELLLKEETIDQSQVIAIMNEV